MCYNVDIKTQGGMTMKKEQIFKIREKYTFSKKTGWELDNETGAVVIYSIKAIYHNGDYYSMETGEEIVFEPYVAKVRESCGNVALQVPGTGVIVYRKNEQGQTEILLQLRKDFNIYGLPGGAIELGQTYEECAAMELFQETAYLANPEDMKLLKIYAGPKHITRYPSGDIVFHSVAVYKIDGSLCTKTECQYDTNETKKIVWANLQEIRTLLNEKLVFPNNVPILEDIVNEYFK